ncbi:Translocase of chloroplast 132, chloroplastic [Apostasia shenzhenica]|uniref:Translocase of chloroplast 132, chloroplastic n=1 Tax=Apostasia shenzhenica TaxID=1088818 RepID=A0A2I0A683_9ASPA|nr:Translocase of chloroplast 132, chloroplastic [Apostasia shenzhenica]
MENGMGLVGQRTVEGEERAGQMEAALVYAVDFHVINGEPNDIDQNEVFEDTMTGVESFHMQQRSDSFHLENDSSSKVESFVGSEVVNGDRNLGQEVDEVLGSADVEDNGRNCDDCERIASEIVESITDSGQLQAAASQEAAVFPEEDSQGSQESAIIYNAEEVRKVDAKELNGDVTALSWQVNPEGTEEQCPIHSDDRGSASEFELVFQAGDQEGIMGINLNGNGSEGGMGISEAYSFPQYNGGIVSKPIKGDLSTEKLENLMSFVVGKGGSCHKEDDFHVLNKYEAREMQIGNKHCDGTNEEIKEEANLSLNKDYSTHSNLRNENCGPLRDGDWVSVTSDRSPNVKEVVLKESVSIEDLGESDSTDDDDDENKPFQPKSSSAPSLPSHPAGLGSSAPLFDPTSRSLQPSRTSVSVPRRQSMMPEETITDDMEESDEIREKLQMIRVKFLRLAHRLGQTPHNVVVAQVLYRLGLAEQLRRNTNRPGVFSYDQASVMAEQLEAAGQEPLDFSCTIMVMGKTGVGKSATINSIFDDAKLCTNAFQLSTKKACEVIGTVQGIKVRVIDTPGLSSCSADRKCNEKILNSIKKFITKTPPDILLYFDRLDMQSRDYGDVPLLRTITHVFGTSIWFNAIVVLTHAASAPPDGPSGSPLSYEMFVTQRSHVIQQAIRQAAGDVRLMNPVSLVENHSACRMNRAGQRVLPNGQVWKPQLLLLSFSSKILQEANILLKLDDNQPGKTLGSRSRVPPLPFLLSSLLQSRPHLRLPEEQMGDEDIMFEDVDTSDSDDGSDYDELPPFKSLTKSQVAQLSKEQRKAYFEELDYREKLLFKKQLKEEKKRRKLLKKMAESFHDMQNDHGGENVKDEAGGPASVPVPMSDLVLPNSFDSDYPSYRYRFLDSSDRWLVRPVLETQGWDHDVGYEGLNVERLFVLKDRIPLSISGQLTKDKKDCNLQMEASSSMKCNKGISSSVDFDLQSVGKEMAYTLRGETKFKNFQFNDTAAGLSITVLGDSMSAGFKVEDKMMMNKRLRMLVSAGAMGGRGDVAYGGRLEATLRGKNYPLERSLASIAFSIVDWHGDLAVGYNIQSQHPLGRQSNVTFHGNMNNKGSGQISIRLNTSEQLQIALLALLPIFRNVFRMLSASSQPM